MRKLAGNLKNSNTLLIFINQIRMKIGVMFGNPETTTGGNALKFYASVRLDIRRIGSVKMVMKSLVVRLALKLLKIKWLHRLNKLNSKLCTVKVLIPMAN